MPTVNQYRRDLDELVRLASLDLDVLWRQVDDAVVARELLGDILPQLVDVYGSAAGTLAADWYDDLREEQAISGSFRALVAELPERAQTEALAGWAVSDMFAAEPSVAGSLGKAQGGLQRLISNVGRGTLIASSLADPQSEGWQRTGGDRPDQPSNRWRRTGGGCGFCQMLVDRGAVYSERGVDFGAHDHCRCGVAPAWSGTERLVKPYAPTERNISDADRERTRQWMTQHGYL